MKTIVGSFIIAIIIYLGFMFVFYKLTFPEQEEPKTKQTTTIKMIEIKPLEELVINHILWANPNSEFETILKKGKNYYVVISKTEVRE